MQPGEETAVCDLVNRVFDEFVAPLFAQEGVREFRTYTQPDAMRHRSQADHFVLVAAAPDQIAGMIEMRDWSHVSLLFVNKEFQGRGISRELLRQALDICQEQRPHLRQVTVNSSPNSVRTYERLGFRATSPEQLVNGIRFTPMILEIRQVG
jgi:predicted GNAT family N-acyltransferase